MGDLPDSWRRGFRRFNSLMILAFRLGLGRLINGYPPVGGRIAVLSTRGRRTGRNRLTPVNYAPEPGAVYVMAGFGKICHWYRNLQADPEVELWLPDGCWTGIAELIREPEARLRGSRAVLQNSGFAASCLAGIDPSIDDDALRAKIENCRLVRIRLVQRSPASCADLFWIWPIVGAVLLAALLRSGS